MNGKVHARGFPAIAQSGAEVKGIDVHVTVADGRNSSPVHVVAGPRERQRRILRIANLPRNDFINFDECAGSAAHQRYLRAKGIRLAVSPASNRRRHEDVDAGLK